jgi:ABC-type phosphate/phosphonate transport system substrate-binding protein
VTPVANARMYSVAPAAAAAWRILLADAIARAGVDMQVIDHPPPAGLPELWSRPDLGAVFMCGWPFVGEGAVRPIVAAPIPDADWSEGRPIYRAEFVVAARSPFHAIEDVLGRRFAYNARHSHSGWNLPRAHLASIGAPPFASLAGPFVTHQRAIAAVAGGEADVASIDSYVLDLLRRHDPALAATIRVIAVTPESPIPLFVGAHPDHGDPLGPLARGKFQAALMDTAPDTLATLGLRGFAIVDANTYAETLST